MFRRLDPNRITETAQRLRLRISERFPESGLSNVAGDLVQICLRTAGHGQWLARPHRALRAGVGICIAGLAAVFAATVWGVFQLPADARLTEVIQAIDAGLNELVFLGIAIFFLTSLEVRRKRRRALQAIHELRSMAHIIDMHQLTKDPERVMGVSNGTDTPSSPERRFSPFQLGRYLDYCSEMLSIVSKAAALYVQDFDDPVTISAVTEIETLTAGLSRKIWQKIMILDNELA